MVAGSGRGSSLARNYSPVQLRAGSGADGRLAIALVVAALLAASLNSPSSTSADPASTSGDMHIPSHPAVEAYARRFAEPRWRPWLDLVGGRAVHVAAHITAALHQRGMPQELVLLPAIESEYRSSAVSNRGAVGIWQLMPTTARALGLVIDDLRDDRRDFWLATEAALTVLEQNLRILGNWDLAVAAYNAGPTRIREAVALTGSRDFWELRARGLLPRQTAEFVPRFYGLVLAARRLQLRVEAPPNGGWSRLPTPAGVDVRVVARLAGVPVDVLMAANSELRYWLTPDGASPSSYHLKVPELYRSAVADVLDQRRNELVRLHLYQIRSGDTLSELAIAFGIPVSLVHRYNPGLRPRQLSIGVRLLLPLRDGIDPATAAQKVQRLVQTSRVVPANWSGSYVVQKGDSLWTIGRRHGASPEQLAAANGIRPEDVLHPETVLVVPGLVGRHGPEDRSLESGVEV